MIRATPIALVLLGGCAGTSTTPTPSLAPRAAEKLGFGEPEQVVVPVTADPVLDARVAALRTRLAMIAAGFDRDAAAAERAARVGAARSAGSEAWLNAQAALAQLDDWRAQASSVVTEADEAAVERAAALLGDYPGLESFATAARAEAARQSAAITRLQALTPTG
ncbi:MAG TPA: hypothetical protein VF695_06450 [Sphingomonas sp.]|jgi:hypothetical protein